MRNRISRLLLAAILGMALAVALFACAPGPAGRGDLVVRFLDVGQGDAIFISLPDQTCMLIDAGPRAAGDDVVAALKDLGVKKIDHVVFTHPHEDHIGGAAAVIKAFEIGQIVMPRTSHTTQTYEDLLTAIDDKDLTVTEAKARTVLVDKDGLRAWLIGPSRSFDDLNDMAAVLALEYGETTFLFEGDAGAEAEAAMMLSTSVQLPRADVLKVAHHGSATSSDPILLGYFDAEYNRGTEQAGESGAKTSSSNLSPVLEFSRRGGLALWTS